MKVIIVGAGKVGEVLCRDLDIEGNDVVLIEEDEAVLMDMLNTADITGLIGNGASYDVLMEAGVDEADFFIAVTQRDEINIISCIIAKKLGAKYTIARVRNPEYAVHPAFMRQSLGINSMINPEKEAAQMVLNLVNYPVAMGYESFAQNRVNLVAVSLAKGSPYIGKSLLQMQNQLSGRVLVGMVERNGTALIPDGSFVMQEEDLIHITGDPRSLAEFYRYSGSNKKRMTSLLIIGASRLTYYLLDLLKNYNIQVKVIELKEDVAERIAAAYPYATVICADGTDQDLLDEEGINRFDCVIASTGIDEENLLISLYAEKCGVRKTITKVNRTKLLKLLKPMSTGAIITPKRIIADMIVRDVRSYKNAQHSSVEKLYRLADGTVEAMQLLIKDQSDVLNKSLQDLPIKKGVLIVAIFRNQEVIYPGGDDCILVGDRVIIVARNNEVEDIDDILER